MDDTPPKEISRQVAQALAIIERHLASTLLAVHLYGSALDGGLKPYSDIDLLVTATARIDDALRKALVTDLLAVSAPPGAGPTLRALEVTVVVRSDVVPWRYPARRELQFGEWQRADIGAGIFEPAVVDPDLAILLTKARHKSKALVGPPAHDFFDPVPAADLYSVLSATLDLWHAPPDWEGEERNILLTLARIWYTAATGEIAPKDVAADWAMERLPAGHRSALREAKLAYTGHAEDRLASRGDDVRAFVFFAKEQITKTLRGRGLNDTVGP